MKITKQPLTAPYSWHYNALPAPQPAAPQPAPQPPQPGASTPALRSPNPAPHQQQLRLFHASYARNHQLFVQYTTQADAEAGNFTALSIKKVYLPLRDVFAFANARGFHIWVYNAIGVPTKQPFSFRHIGSSVYALRADDRILTGYLNSGEVLL